jgi:hypothetical protein
MNVGGKFGQVSSHRVLGGFGLATFCWTAGAGLPCFGGLQFRGRGMGGGEHFRVGVRWVLELDGMIDVPNP